MNGECEKCWENAFECQDHERVEISYCELSVRAENLLRINGIKYVDELVQLSSREIITWKNFGKKSLNDIRDFLAKNNLALKDESINPNVHNMILKDLPSILNGIKIQVNEAVRELRYFSLKLEQISSACEKRAEKLK